MKKLLLILFALPLCLHAQHKSCCKASSTEQFSMLALNENFASSHSAPIPFTYNSEKGTMVTYKSADGFPVNAFEIRSDKKTDNWLIVIHEWWGLNDYIKQISEKLYNDIGNVNVIAIDLYDGMVAATPKEAQETMSSMKEEHTRAIIEGTFTHLGPNAKIATIGWCMGGAWSLQTSIMAGKKGIACVMYYGMPEKDLDKLRELNCDVLGIFAKRDEWITPAVAEEFENNMREAGKKVTIKLYDAVHAFANPSNKDHDKAATADAYATSLDFLKQRIK